MLDMVINDLTKTNDAQQYTSRSKHIIQTVRTSLSFWFNLVLYPNSLECLLVDVQCLKTSSKFSTGDDDIQSFMTSTYPS